MNTAFTTSSLKEFVVEYEQGLKSTAPVKTGRLRDSIAVQYPTLAALFHVDTLAVDYAIYANNKHHFVERNDYKVEEFATNITESLWDDFFTENKTPNT